MTVTYIGSMRTGTASVPFMLGYGRGILYLIGGKDKIVLTISALTISIYK